MEDVDLKPNIEEFEPLSMAVESMPKLPSADAKFVCNFCSRAFKRKDRLDVHLKVHTGDRPYICGVPGCYSSYTRLQHLQRHIERVHFAQNTVESKLECPHCDAMLANPECLKRHEQRFHTGAIQGKVFECPEEGCNEVFRKKSQLITHREQDHSFSSPNAARCHKCPYDGCGKSFPFPTVLRRHMKVHQGYECDVDGCSEVFETYFKLRKHKAVAHGPDLVCHQCQAPFKSRQTLVQHLKTHLFVKEVFSCTEVGCERTFLYKKNLKQHIRAYHLGERVFMRKKVPKDVNQTPKIPKPRKGVKNSAAGSICGVNDRSKMNLETPLDLSVPCNDEQDQNPSCSFEDILHKFYPPSEHSSDSSSDMDYETDPLQAIKDIIEKKDSSSTSTVDVEKLNRSISECVSSYSKSDQKKGNLSEYLPMTSGQEKDNLSECVPFNYKQELSNSSVCSPLTNYEQEKDNITRSVPSTHDKLEKDNFSQCFPATHEQE